jgi:CRP/FNR family cyclic AMP-dependent transcriptional regulator
MYVVVSGALVVTALCPNGREAVLGLLGPGQPFGQATLVDGRQRGTARALGRCVIEALEPMEAAQALAARCDALEEWLADLVLLDVPARLAKRLCELAGLVGRHEPDGVLIEVPLTQAQLASLVAATRESVNRALARLVRERVVRRVGRGYLVTDQGALHRIAGRGEDSDAATGGLRRW